MSASRLARESDGQALIELALGLPILLLAALFAFALIDAVTTQESVQSGVRRAASALAGSNDDAQATGAAASSGWLRGQSISVTLSPDASQRRCFGTPVDVTVTAPGHLGFLLPVATAWTATQRVAIENEGSQRAACGSGP